MSDAERPLAAAVWLNAPETQEVLAALSADGRPPRFVGGCVRDTLLDPAADAADLDLATPELPERVLALCAGAGLKAIPTGLRHGTITVHHAGRRYEVTTLRRDLATDGRHAEVAFTDDFLADAARRDFTINAISCDGEGRLFDPLGGRADLEAGLVRFVGEPQARIREDYLRILRFFRFYARFGRPPADQAALEACRELAPGISRLSGERMREELLRLLRAPGAVAAIELMRASSVLGLLLPGSVRTAPLEALAAHWPCSDALLRLALLLRSAAVDEPTVTRLAARLRLSRAEANRLQQLTQLPLPGVDLTPREHRQAFYRLGPDIHLALLRLAMALGHGDPADMRAAEALAASWSAPTLPVSGDDLRARGIAPGPELGALLGRLRHWWEARDFTPDRAACLAHLDTLLGPRPPTRNP